MTIDVIELAKDLIRCPSVTPESAGVMDVLEGVLKPLGFEVWRVTFSEENERDVENLYARLGTAAPNVCFAGHTDVVPPGDPALWESPPFQPEVRGGMLYGRGAEDMKGAIAAFVAAVSRMVENKRSHPGRRREAPEIRDLVSHERIPDSPSGFRDVSDYSVGMTGGSVSLLITNDEEGLAINGTRKMLDWLKARGEVLDACIVGEPTNPSILGEMIKVGRRGSITCNLTVNGKQGHVAYPERADNPVTRLVKILHDLETHVLDEGNGFFPPSNLEITSIDVGNPTVNLIPASAYAQFNIRFNNLHNGADLGKWLYQVCERHATTFELNCRVSGESFLTRDEPLILALSKAIIDVTGVKPELSTTGGTSDARFIKDVCPVIEFGTTGQTPHAVNECVDVDVLRQLSAVYERFLVEYFGR